MSLVELSMLKSYKYLLGLSLVTPLLLIIAVFFLGGGHGWYEPAIILFPLGFLGAIRQNSDTLFIILALLQFPLYGLLLDLATKYNNQRKVLRRMIVTHVMLVGIILIIKGLTQIEHP
jgi:hypothetical protein